ncbi:MAG: MarR family transcriptional regulator [Chloroflexi bacterium]|nr:MarR family transcriptional regulator [Chloroflexota bacterium]
MTRPDPHPTSETAARVIPPLLRLARAIETSLRTGGASLGLTPAQAETLRFAGTVRPDVATIGQLARVLGVRHATAVGVVGPLVARGLVERRPHPFDGRRRVLGLTPAGQGVLVRLERLTDELANALGTLEPSEAAGLEVGLGAIVAALRRRGALVIAAPCAGCIHFLPDATPGSNTPHRCALLRRYLSDAESRLACPEHKPAA